MKSPVKLSLYSVFSSALILIVLLVLLYNSRTDFEIWLDAGMIVFLMLCVLIYMPLSISADANGLVVRRPLKSKTIQLSEIQSIALCQSAVEKLRYFGSGGFFGYWGWFRDRRYGKYFAYYGNTSNCFLLRLNDGRQYVLGCENPQAIVETVQAALGNRC
ncbi:MAG: PH domain-containing protein [Paramuribaculum sp.]|nr:PH domain-containing protein [Paramuribaculum sp.]